MKQQRENTIIAGAQSKSQCWGRSLRDFKPVLSRIYALKCVLGSVQTPYAERKTVRNETKKAAGIHEEGGLRTLNNNYQKCLLFAKLVRNGHRMLGNVTFLPSSSVASPSAFLTLRTAESDAATCDGFRALPVASEELRWMHNTSNLSGKFAGNAFDGQREQTSQRGRFPGLRRLCTCDGVSTADSQRRQTPVRISAPSALRDKLQLVAPANHTLTAQANIYLDCLSKYIL